MSDSLISFDFEIFGKVQKVYFRAHTQEKAVELGIVGTVENTKRGTVTGTACGPAGKMAQFKRWLQHEGSPKSRIDKAVFTNEQEVEELTHESFEVLR